VWQRGWRGALWLLSTNPERIGLPYHVAPERDGVYIGVNVMPRLRRWSHCITYSARVGLMFLSLVGLGCAARSSTNVRPENPSVSYLPTSEFDDAIMVELAHIYAEVRTRPVPEAVVAEADALAKEAQVVYLLGQIELGEELLIEAIALYGDRSASGAADSGSLGEDRSAGDRPAVGDGPDR